MVNVSNYNYNLDSHRRIKFFFEVIHNSTISFHRQNILFVFKVEFPIILKYTDSLQYFNNIFTYNHCLLFDHKNC